MMNHKTAPFIIALLLTGFVNAQHEDQIFITADGIMHWSKDSSEVTGFGENYTVPFAYGYRAAKRMGVDLKAAIDQDVYQFARLDFDLFRVHVWDCEISDTLGNLIDNEHLELFDYLLWKLKEKGINAVITPIAYWGNGWPERDEPTPGFATKYGKGNCLTNPDAIKAQEKYLYQFVNHINRYTGIAYKNDPQVLAFEICNEPHHREGAEAVTAFVRKMKDAIQSAGCTKPILYNVSHGINYAQAYFDAGIDGGTFQWYPTGLGFQKELRGNMLPNVDRYEIPFDDVLKKNHAIRFVYEFDAADMATSYMYPAMARSFRTAGMQLATHFAWDPTYTAPYNTEYNTHFMNLFYAPQKALSLMICAEIFRTIPLYKDFGVYPDNSSFGPFRVSYQDNLAEMVTDEKFIYTNHTNTKPPAPEKLELIAGYGNSSLVEYEGTGAYFFDKLGEGMWKLELMPDAIVIDNLFGRNSLDKTRAIVTYNRRKMKINLPGLEGGYSVESLDWRDSILYRETWNGEVGLKPGTYLILSPAYEKNDSITFQSKRKIVLKDSIPFPEVSKIINLPPASKSENVNTENDEIILFDALHDSDRINWQWRPGSGPDLEDPDFPNFHLQLKGIPQKDDENPNAIPVNDYTIHWYVADKIKGKVTALKHANQIIFNGYATGDMKFPIQISLIMNDGSAFGSLLTLEPNAEQDQYIVSLDQFQRIKPVLMPRPYPTFLPYYSYAGKATTLDLSKVEAMQISIGPGIPIEDVQKTFDLRINSIWFD
ncbi:MAG TPA: cellulase family glycosylhydrolase [Saprospiraceae bacterium]|nr:cellulase family glycosylhydrolase [Saprospiraceae bacterium]